MYTHFLICYDIPNTPKRTKFAEMLKDLGLVALQKSVFYGALTATERHALDFSSRKLLGAEDKAYPFLTYDNFAFVPESLFYPCFWRLNHRHLCGSKTAWTFMKRPRCFKKEGSCQNLTCREKECSSQTFI